MTPELASKPPTIEQLERIRQVSAVAYSDKEGASGWAFKIHGFPQNRGEASVLLRKLNEARRYDQEGTDPDDTPNGEKTCSKCGEPKPLSEFYPRRDRPGYRPYCKTCHNTKEEEMPAETRECDSCSQTKPLDEFAKRTSGRARVCRDCESPEISSTTTEEEAGGGVIPSATPPPILNGRHDPTLSQLRELRSWGGYETLDEAAEVWEKVLELAGVAE